MPSSSTSSRSSSKFNELSVPISDGDPSAQGCPESMWCHIRVHRLSGHNDHPEERPNCLRVGSRGSSTLHASGEGLRMPPAPASLGGAQSL
ncbi:Os04g0109250 [Oryza sativa Japonica Group]|uniref:Os04g0109250 protein n=1 Tax=Oryza sativa subsp. japonica TaxID=39947 RepID=A0A0P0W6N5_ORYSJ|nr:Os04g0109250 [Oryza sativa Japonica Group]